MRRATRLRPNIGYPLNPRSSMLRPTHTGTFDAMHIHPSLADPRMQGAACGEHVHREDAGVGAEPMTSTQ
jgi:hypothetical protein